MKQKFNVIGIIGIFTIALAFPMVCMASESFVLINTDDATILKKRSEPIFFWMSDDWSLVDGEMVSGLEPILTLESECEAYLVTRSDKAVRGAELSAGWLEIEKDLFLIQALPSEAEMLPLNGWEITHLGAPFPWSEPRSASLPTVHYDDRVAQFSNAVSEADLMADLSALVGFETRNSYAPQCIDAGNWIGDQFASYGLSVEYQTHQSDMAPNVIGELTGRTTPEEIVIVCAHYDSTSLYNKTDAPGADDNGTGTSAVLQAAKILADSGFERTIRFIAFSGEEQGKRGSHDYATRMVNEDANIVGVFNFDMIGWVEPYPENLDCIGNNNSRDLVEFFIQCAQMYTGLPTLHVINDSMTRSDHASFWSRGFPAMCGIEDNPPTYPYYHSIQDTEDKINVAFFADSTRGALAALSQMAIPTDDMELTPTPTDLDIGVEIVLNREEFTAGDFFHLGVTYWNNGSEHLQLPLCVMLEVAGDFWFWPSWRTDLDYQFFDLKPGLYLADEVLMEFVWPNHAGQMSALAFYGAFLTEDISMITGSWDRIDWRFY